MEEIKVEAKLENLDKVTGFVEGILEENDCPMKVSMKLAVAIEELFVNVANYAYNGSDYEKNKKNTENAGTCILFADIIHNGEKTKIIIKMMDWGQHFNPLDREDPDITLSADERGIGGLGIYMVKKTMDAISYAYIDDANVLTMEKSWSV